MTQSGLGRGLGKWKANSHTQLPHPKVVHKGQAEQLTYKTHKENDFTLIAADKIHPNPYQPRRAFTEENLQQLTDSIGTEGLLQPILVKAQGDSYQLIAGERRLKACQQLKLPPSPRACLKPTANALQS